MDEVTIIRKVDYIQTLFRSSSVVEQPAVNRLVVGSSPTFGAIIWPLGQAVKTPPFHGGNTGSNPVGVTN